jgi:hypothetical protein
VCRRSLPQRCLVPALLLLLLPALPGCLIPYGFPKISQTPLLSLGKEAEEIHAFRADITRDFVDIGGTDRWTFSEVTSSPAGWVLPQTKVSATCGIYVFGVALNYPVYTSHSVALKLYRPGYELVELDSWEVPGMIVWKEAPDLASQEKALDRLFLREAPDSANEPRSWVRIGRRLSPGSEGAEHQRVLLFGASEYERLASGAAASGSEEGTTCGRLRSKARELRELAGEAEPPPSFRRLWRGDS